VIPPDVALLVLRIAIAAALYGFLGALLYFTMREMQAASHQVGHAVGRLRVMAAEGGVPLEEGRTYPLHIVTTLGRSPTNSIALPDSFASSEHARITFRRGQWWLADLDSRNGTTLNGMIITGPVVLSPGDEIGIGRVTFRLVE
jgi:hypothetical protein